MCVTSTRRENEAFGTLMKRGPRPERSQKGKSEWDLLEWMSTIYSVVLYIPLQPSPYYSLVEFPVLVRVNFPSIATFITDKLLLSSIPISDRHQPPTIVRSATDRHNIAKPSPDKPPSLLPHWLQTLISSFRSDSQRRRSQRATAVTTTTRESNGVQHTNGHS